jgi:hypothetical protein
MSNNQPHTGPKNKSQNRYPSSKPTTVDTKAGKADETRVTQFTKVKPADTAKKSNV